MRMVLGGPSNLAELTAEESPSEPLERSKWLMVELQCELRRLEPADPPEQPRQQPH